MMDEEANSTRESVDAAAGGLRGEPLQRPWLFGVFGLILLLILWAPGEVFRTWGGGLVALAGLLMMVFPPTERMGWLRGVLACGFLLAAGLALLPAAWFPQPAWRAELGGLGMPLAPTVTLQPLWTQQSFAAMAVTLVGALYILGQRTDHGGQHRVALWFSAAVALLVLISQAAQHGRWVIPWDKEPSFGFFPNRNHFGTFMVMGIMAGLGVAVQSVRVKRPFSAALAILSVMAILTGLVRDLGSRGGLLLLAIAFCGWVMLMGNRYLGRRLLAAVALLAAAGIIYVSSGPSLARDRLAVTAERTAVILADNTTTTGPGEGGQELASVDARIPIQKDTLGMIRDFPITGVGAGQFGSVYPQYRNLTAFQNEMRSLHPESDWLLVAAECGMPAAILMALLVAACFWPALRGSLHGHARALRIGCLMGAATLPIHGIGDVPAHHIGLAWAAAWLVALSTRSHRAHPPGRLEAGCFRLAGVGVVAAGVALVWMDQQGSPTLARSLERTVGESARALFAEDARRQEEAERQAAATAGGAGGKGEATAELPADQASAPEVGPDLLEVALAQVTEAQRQVPMAASLYGIAGSAQVVLDEGLEPARKTFQIQRRLNPMAVPVPLQQASAWAPYVMSEVPECWAEAIRRAELIEGRYPGSAWGPVPVFGRMMSDARKWKAFIPAVLATADAHPGLLEQWAREAGPERMDAWMPAFVKGAPDEAARARFLLLWQQQGAKGPPQPR
jgi:O-antigen ligase